MPTQKQIHDELKSRGYHPEIDGKLVVLDINPALGYVRSYVIEEEGDQWAINQRIITFDDGNDSEEDSDLGTFSTLDEIIAAIDEYEAP